MNTNEQPAKRPDATGPQSAETEPFSLANEPTPRKPARFESSDAKQRQLLDGLDCLPGQQDLF